MRYLRKTAIDRKRHEILIDDVLVILSPLQFELLAILVEADGAVITRNKMMKDVWGHPKHHIAPRTVDQHISRLRVTLERLGIENEVVKTVPVLGYKFNRFGSGSIRT